MRVSCSYQVPLVCLIIMHLSVVFHVSVMCLSCVCHGSVMQFTQVDAMVTLLCASSSSLSI